LAGIFRAYDLRGKLGETLTPKIMENIGKAVGTLYKRVMVGADLRYSSPEMKGSFISGFKTTGSDLFIGPEGSAGLVWYSAHIKNAVCAYITASHLNSEWNGLKLHHGTGVSATPDEIRRLEAVYNQGDFQTGESHIENIDFSQKYCDIMTEEFKAKCDPVIDFGGGAASKHIPDIWRKVANNPKFLFEKTDPYLKVRDPEPNEHTLTELRKMVQGKDIGMGYDGDGDRVTFFDETGQRVLPENIVILLSKDIHKPKIVVNVECSNVIKDYLPDAKIYTVPVGHGFVTPACMNHKADFGVESSGHFVVGKYFYFDDAVIASLAAADELEGKLSNFTKKLPKYYYEQVNFRVPDEEKEDLMIKIKEKMEQDYEVNTMDGVKVILDDAWVLIRQSLTEAKVRLTIEAETKDRLENLKKQFSELIQ